MRLSMNDRLRGLIINSLLFALIWGQTAGSVLAEEGVTPSAMKLGSPAGSYESLIDTVNLFSGNLNFRISLLTAGGRGEVAYPLVFSLNPKWSVNRIARPGEAALLSPSFNPGKQIGGVFGVRIVQVGSRDFTNRCGKVNVHRETLTIVRFTVPDGTTYELRDKLTNGEPNSTSCTNFNRGRVFVAADGTSATFISDTDIFDRFFYSDSSDNPRASGYVLLRDGTRFRLDNGKIVWMRDCNGNKLSFSDPEQSPWTITDSIGRQVVINSGAPQSIDFKGYGGAPRTIRIQSAGLGNALRSGFNLRTERDLFPQFNDSLTSVVNPGVTSSITLPNNQQYKFYYNSYAELARVELPTGGAIEYDYAPGLTDGPESGHMNLGVVGGHHIYRRVIERRVYLDGGSGGSFAMRTTYSRPESSSSNAGYVQTNQYDSTGALLGSRRHYFHGSARDSFGKHPTLYPPWQEGLEYQTEELDILRGTVLRRVTHTWNQPVAGSHWPLTQLETQAGARSNDPHITETVTTLFDITPNLVSKKTFAYDEYNNQTDVWAYGFGAGAPGPLIRRKHIDYVTLNNGVDYAADTNIHIRNLPLKTQVFDADGIKRAETLYEYDLYDESPNHALLIDRPGISGLDSGFTTGYTMRGNVTKTSSALLNDSGGVTGWVNSHAQYDIAGNIVKAIDANDKAATLDFSDRFGPPGDDARQNTPPAELNGQTAYAFATKVTDALGHTTYTKYDYHLGKPDTSEDPNGIVSSIAYNDVLDRPTQSIHARYKVTTPPCEPPSVCVPAEKRQTTITYDDTNRVITTTSDRGAFNDNILKSKVYYDSFGRTWRGAAYEGSTWSITDTRFDALGRVSQVSNPYRDADPDSASSPSGEFAEWTKTVYDALSRVTQVVTPDGAHVDTVYSGNLVTVTDQASKKRRSETDALGRLIKIIEDPDGLNYETHYSYDALGNLRQVAQGTQTRTFDYDSLSQLISATNPESGPITYAYDANSNLIEKIDARGVKTTMSYDAINRVRSKVYSGITPEGTAVANVTPPVHYFYDVYSGLPSGAPSWSGTPSKGRLIGVTYGSGSEGTYYKYDVAGRIVTSNQRQGTANYATIYEYNLAGNMTFESRGTSKGDALGSRRRYLYMFYDEAGRLSAMDTIAYPFTGGNNLVRDISYTPFGTLQSERYGNGLIHSMNYNTRHQPTEIRLGRPDNLESVFRLGYFFGTANNVNGQDYEITPAHNNGNVARIKYFISGTVQYTQTFQYDPLNRLRYAVEHNNGVYNDTSRAWYQTFDYDRYGNRGIKVTDTSDNVDGANSALQLAEFSASNNRITRAGFVYDAAGNLIEEPGKIYTYDAENRMVMATVGGVTSQCFYDGNSRRIRKVVGGVATRFEYGARGELIAERNESNGSLKNDYFYRDGQLLASTKTGTTYEYATADHLGSPRAWTDHSGNLVAGGRHDYLPFGGELFAGVGNRTTGQGYATSTQQDGQRKQYTSKERDSETGLDYFLARYHSSMQGRFASVDPENYGAEPEDPQSWNGYAYARNNPVLYTDPDGRKYLVCSASTVHCGWVSDREFNLDRASLESQGLEFTGGRGFRSQGSILFNGEVQATYEQWSIDDRAKELAFHMQGALRSPELARRVVAGTISGAAIAALLGGRGGVGLPRPFRPKLSTVDAHSRAAAAADRGGYTKAGRSLTKHGAGARPGNSKFPTATGNPQQINQTAQNIVDDILTNPGTIVTNSYRGRFGNTIEYTAPDGRGLVFKASGEFLFFKE
jgi:RHS repeat-associated protein